MTKEFKIQIEAEARKVLEEPGSVISDRHRLWSRVITLLAEVNRLEKIIKQLLEGPQNSKLPSNLN